VTQPVGLVVSNLAGSAAITTVQDGQGAGAGFWFPRAVAYAPDGTLYVADAMYIRKVLPDGTTSTLAGCGFNEYADGIGANACFSNPNALTVDAQGNVWVADTGNCTVRKVTPAGVVTTPFNATLIPGYANCANLDTNGSTFNTITGIALRPNGNVIISNGYQIFEVSLSGQGILATVGTFAPGFANGRSDTARFNGILSIVLDANGNLYMADQGNDAVRLWNYGDGSISTLAGGTYHLSFDGVGALAGIHGVSGVAVDSAGMVYLCDSTTVRKVPAYDGHTPSQVTRVAGQFSLGSHVDGDALTVATFTNSPSLAVGPGGIIAVADPWEHRIRVIH
jgi:hypothetical protein